MPGGVGVGRISKGKSITMIRLKISEWVETIYYLDLERKKRVVLKDFQ